MSAETVYVTGGRARRTLHSRPDCERLAPANSVIEKPAAVFPEGYFDECEFCMGGEG